MRQYLTLLETIMREGRYKNDRTGTGCYSYYGYQYRVKLSEGFPLLTTKSVPLRWVFEELRWFLQGDYNNNTLLEKKVTIWNEWALENDHIVAEGKPFNWTETLDSTERLIPYMPRSEIRNALTIAQHRDGQAGVSKWLKDHDLPDRHPPTVIPAGSLGPIYGVQWRDFCGVDQIEELMVNLKERPFSRRHVVSAWNPTVLPDEKISPQENVKLGNAALASCHCLFQMHCMELTLAERAEAVSFNDLDDYLHEDGEERFIGAEIKLEEVLDALNAPKIGSTLQFYQRSADTAAGVAFNIASYSLLLIMICNELNYYPMDVVHDIGDAHIYSNHLTGVKEQLSRTPGKLPTVRLKCPVGTSIFDITWEDIELLDYHPQDKIVYPISI